MNIVPTKATVGTAKRMVAGWSTDGADAVLEHLPSIPPDQITALMGVLVRLAAGHSDLPPHTIITDPKWICDEALRLSAHHYGLTGQELLSGRRNHITRARAVSMAAAHHAGVAYAEIGRQYFRDHTTVMFADRKVLRDPDLWAVARSIGDRLRSSRSGAA